MSTTQDMSTDGVALRWLTEREGIAECAITDQHTRGFAAGAHWKARVAEKAIAGEEEATKRLGVAERRAHRWMAMGIASMVTMLAMAAGGITYTYLDGKESLNWRFSDSLEVSEDGITDNQRRAGIRNVTVEMTDVIRRLKRMGKEGGVPGDHADNAIHIIQKVLEED